MVTFEFTPLLLPGGIGDPAFDRWFANGRWVFRNGFWLGPGSRRAEWASHGGVCVVRGRFGFAMAITRREDGMIDETIASSSKYVLAQAAGMGAGDRWHAVVGEDGLFVEEPGRVLAHGESEAFPPSVLDAGYACSVMYAAGLVEKARHELFMKDNPAAAVAYLGKSRAPMRFLETADDCQAVDELGLRASVDRTLSAANRSWMYSRDILSVAGTAVSTVSKTFPDLAVGE